MTTTQRLTFEDLMALPEDGNRHELVRGEFLTMPPPKEGHGYIIEAALVETIGGYLSDPAYARGWEKNQGRSVRDRLVGRLISGAVGVRFSVPDDPDQTRGLDVGYLSPTQVARLGPISHARHVREMPILVAEIVSPSETASYINEKVADYLAGSARLVWLLYPKTRTVEVYRADGTGSLIGPEGILDGEDILPGFAEQVSFLFPDTIDETDE